MAEVFSTFTTLIRHFSCVDSLVLSEIVFSTKGFSTFIALIRSLSSVDPLVLDKCSFTTKGFPTLTALMRLFPAVDPLVLDKRIFATESFPAFTALVMHLSNMQDLPACSSLGCLPLGVGDLLLAMAQASLDVLLLHLTCKEIF